MLHSAGILPVCDNKILLGREKRGWSGFSGKSENNESPFDTAKREFTEETAGLFCDVVINYEKYKLLETKTPSGYPFFLYIMEFPYIEHINQKFKLQLKNATNKNEKEKEELAWVNIWNVNTVQLSRSFSIDWKSIKKLILQRYENHNRPRHHRPRTTDQEMIVQKCVQKCGVLVGDRKTKEV